jgi:glycolate oxidase FAD binding subunit
MCVAEHCPIPTFHAFEPMDTELLKLREHVLIARANQTPLQLHGARTKDFYGESLAGEPLDVSGYRGIVDYEPSELVISARCGTPLSEIETALAGSGQFLAFEPPRFGGRDPTLGGVIATGLSGPRRMQVGAARDFVLGATLLAADGELLRFGGQVMKNVAGFDVSRLLCGSLGILGIMTELSIKVLPLPRAQETMRLEMPAREAVDAFNRWAGQPLPISAAAWHGGHAWVRLSGAEPAVNSARDIIGGERISPTVASQWWDALRHYTHPLFSDTSVWRVSVPATAPPLRIPSEPLIDWGGALRWYAGDSGAIDVRGLAVAVGGTAMRWRGAVPDSRFHPLPPAIVEIHRRLKHSFDPEGIFNPGRLLPGL